MSSQNHTHLESINNTLAEEWTGIQLLLALLLGAITLTTILGNCLVLYLFWKSKRSLRSPTHYFIANLAIADLCVGFLVLPGLTSITINNFKWKFGDFICSLNEYFHFCLCAASMLSVMIIALERYIGVTFPMRHKRILNRRRVITFAILVWILAFVLTATPLSVWPLQEVRAPGTCPVNLRSNFVFFISISVYWIPVTSTAILYFFIYRNAVKLYTPGEIIATQFPSIVSNSSRSNMHATKTGKAGMTDQERFLDTRKKQAKLANKLSRIVIIMLVLYGPLFAVFMGLGFDQSFLTPQLLLTLGWLRYFSSCVNPFLYIMVIPGYKKAFMKTIWNEKSEINKKQSNSDSNPKSSSSSGYSSGNYESKKSIKRTSRFIESIDSGIRKNYSASLDQLSVKSTNKTCENCGKVLPIEITSGTDRISNICPICDLGVCSNKKYDMESTDVNNAIINQHIKDDASDPKTKSVNSQTLALELHNFQKAVEEEQTFQDQKRNKRNEEMLEERANRLLHNLVTSTASEIHIDEDVRKSLVESLEKRKSQIMTNDSNTSVEVDRVHTKTLQTLDEIISQLQNLTV